MAMIWACACAWHARTGSKRPFETTAALSAGTSAASSRTIAAKDAAAPISSFSIGWVAMLSKPRRSPQQNAKEFHPISGLPVGFAQLFERLCNVGFGARPRFRNLTKRVYAENVHRNRARQTNARRCKRHQSRRDHSFRYVRRQRERHVWAYFVEKLMLDRRVKC